MSSKLHHSGHANIHNIKKVDLDKNKPSVVCNNSKVLPREVVLFRAATTDFLQARPPQCTSPVRHGCYPCILFCTFQGRLWSWGTASHGGPAFRRKKSDKRLSNYCRKKKVIELHSSILMQKSSISSI